MHVAAQKEGETPVVSSSPLMAPLIAAWEKRLAAETEARRVAEENRRAEEARRTQRQTQALAALARPAEQLTAQTENFFAQAKANDTSAIWTEAAVQARRTSQAWNNLLVQLSMRLQLITVKGLANSELASAARLRDTLQKN